MTYRAGVIGCGRIGCAFDDDPKRKYIATHAGAYFNSEKVDLVALSDVDTEKLHKYGKKYNLPLSSLYTDHSDMLQREKLDILSICTWNSTHLEIAEKAVEHGIKAIFCEKPIADTLSNARKVANICKEHNVILMIDHQRRFDPFHREIRNFMQDGKLGTIQKSHVYYTAGIANTGSHVFDLLRFFFGDAEYVQSHFSQTPSPNSSDPNIDGVVMFKNGTLCMIQSCDVKHYLILEFDILGTSGRIRITHSGFDCEYYQVKESHLFSGYKELYQSRKPFDVPVQKQFMVNAVQHLVDCIENKRIPVSSGLDGLGALELICAFYESALQNGAKISLPLLKSDITIKSR